MSIIANYVRLTDAQIEACAQTPDALLEGSIEGVEVIDIDGAWGPLAWLLSDLKRAEDAHNAAVLNDHSAPAKPSLLDRLLRRKPADPIGDALRARVAELDAMPEDPLVIAIEGRSARRDPRFDHGIGDAAVFVPGEVSALSAALDAVTEAIVEAHYDPAAMDAQLVFPQTWTDEGDELLEEYIKPGLRRLQAFYRAAATEGQHVLVLYT